MSEIVTKSAKDGIKVANGRTVTGIITRQVVDEEGEVLIAGGLDTSYISKTKGLLFNHDFNKPIGSIRRIDPLTDSAGNIEAWKASVFLANTPLGEECLTLAECGGLHFSVGFSRQEGGAPTADEKKSFAGVEYVTRKWKMHELSLTPVPANADALVETVQKGLIRHSTYKMIMDLIPEGTNQKAVFLSLDDEEPDIMLTLDM